MKASTLRIYLSVHTWVGLLSGMALFIAFYAGAITVFSHELTGWERPPAAMPAETQAIAQAQALVDGVMHEHGSKLHDFYVSLPGEHGPETTLYWYDTEAAQQHRFVLDDAGGVAQTPARDGFVAFIYDLHFTAGLPRTFGTYLFGIVCILYGLALVSGVVLYLPTFFKDLFALRLGRNIKRLWQDAHNVVGVLSLPFHVIFAWSGAVLTIGFIMLAPFQFLVFENKLMPIVERDFDVATHVESAGRSAPMLPVAELLARARVALPGLEIESLSYHDAGDANARVTLYGDLPQRRLNHHGGVALDAVSGEVVNALGPRDYPPGMAMLRGLQALHYGDFGASAVKWLYFALGMAGAFLFYSGNLLWIESRRKRRQVDQPRRTRVMAALTLGTCLGCIAGVSATFLAGALLPPGWVPTSYFIVFFAAIAWACLRAPARAAHELLWACAVLTAAIPVAGFAGSGEHLFAALIAGHWDRVLTDATALVMAFAFWRMAVATLRRGRDGDPNSVWALPARR